MGKGKVSKYCSCPSGTRV